MAQKVSLRYSQRLGYLLDHLGYGSLTDPLYQFVSHKKLRYISLRPDSPVQNAEKNSQKYEQKIKPEELMTMYRSYGIPPELVAEMAKENDVEVEIPGNFYALIRTSDEVSADEKEEDKEVGSGSKEIGGNKSKKLGSTELAHLTKTKTLYYSTEGEFTAKVLDIFDNQIVLDQTAFYPEGGGQVADTGLLNDVEVGYVSKNSGVILHKVKDS